jgi:elongation factor G
MAYSAQNIRNICLLGHSGNGKTTLVESFQLMTGAIDRLGRTADGNTICDTDAEEIKRQISIYASIAPVEYNGTKINVLDTPGNFDFAGEVQECLRVADAGIIVCDAKGGLSVGTERAWKYLNEHKLPRFIYISKTDEDNGDFNGAFDTLRDHFGKNIAPLVAPIWDENKKVVGIVDVVHKRAYEVQNGKSAEIPVPENKLDVVQELYDALMESVAETSEEFMEKYFAGEEFTYAEVIQGLKAGVRDGSLIPVLCGSALSGLGTVALLNAIVDLAPCPTEGIPETVENENGEAEQFIVAPGALPAAFVFKTFSDQYGKFSYVKVMSGTLTPDMPIVNARTGETEKLGRLYSVKGRKTTEVKELTAGDIGAIAKMDKLKTGDSLCSANKIVKFAGFGFAQPTYQKAIAPKTRGQEDKIAAGLTRLNEEDPTFTVVNNAETHQTVVTAVGDIQLDVLVSKLQSRFNVEAVLSDAKVAYRECIRKKVKVQGRHKKQTGGSGQFGDVWIEFEPGEQEEMEFCENVFGGSVPKNFFPAVEKGLREACVKGPLAGYPVVNLKCTLVDGSYHPVDSSEIAFKTAAQLAYKAGMPQAGPVILEPIGTLKVTIPDSYLGDIMGDLNKRRGRVMGMNPTDAGEQVVEAEVPMAEMMSYAIELRSMTQSRGSFEIAFNRYEEAPRDVQQKIIAEAANREE